MVMIAFVSLLNRMPATLDASHWSKAASKSEALHRRQIIPLLTARLIFEQTLVARRAPDTR